MISAKSNLSRPDPGQVEKINTNFYFHTSLWCLKRFDEGRKDLDFHKTFRGTKKKVWKQKFKLIFT